VVDIFDEISEDLRADRARALLARYGGVFLAACVLVLVGVGAWQIYHQRADKENQRVAGLFIAATTEAATANTAAVRATAIAQFQDVQKQGHPAYTVLARLDEATLRDDSGDHQGALVLWDQVAGDGSATPAIRDLAALLWVQHQVDNGDPVLLTGRLQPLLAGTNVWHALASEQMALLEVRQGQTGPARQRLQALEIDPTASQNVRSRALTVLAGLGG